MIEQQRKPRIRPRRIIERPRLIRALDESNARIKLLVAGSGWGKTVLAEQWVASGERTVGWYRARRSAADVAVVARGLVAAADVVVPGAGRRMLERLAVTDDPGREAVLLAEMLADDLRGWPADRWVAIDNYERLAPFTASEEFVQTLIRESPLRTLVISRSRPRWTLAREMMSTEALEVSKERLRLTADEIRELLGDSRLRLSSMAALADGLPALVGLAAMVPGASTPDVRSAGAMHEFYARELLGRLEQTMRESLITVASLPSIDRELVEDVLGSSHAHELWTQAIEIGIADEREERLELEPLLQAHLERRAAKEGSRALTIARVLSIYRHRRDWDSSFEMIRQHGLDDEIVGLLLGAVEEILFAGRLSTLRDWVEFARTRGLPSHPVFAIADLEIQLRHGRHATALAQSRSLLTTEGVAEDVLYRLYMIAARAAHGVGREEEALDYYSRAGEKAPSMLKEREARWGELMAMSTLERPEAQELLDELVTSVVDSDVKDLVRVADRQLCVGFRFGSVRHLPDSRRASELVDQVDDPFVRCSFLSVHAWALLLGAYYDEALRTTDRLLKDTIELRVDPVLPNAYATQAVAFAGLGRDTEARRSVDLAERLARDLNDENGLQNAYATRVHVLLHAGAAAEACALEPPDLGSAVPNMRGEVLASRALALATLGRTDEAADLADAAVRATSGIEARALSVAVAAVCSLKRRSDDVVTRCDDLIEHVFATGAADIAVTTYRANPDILATLVASRQVRDQTVYLIRRAGDEQRIEALGLTATAILDPAIALSAREREVYDLVCEGLSNAEIARRLYITEGTVKAHVHHVFDKTGIRSRRALALNAARQRYATSAAGSDETSVVGGGTTTPNPAPRAAR